MLRTGYLAKETRQLHVGEPWQCAERGFQSKCGHNSGPTLYSTLSITPSRNCSFQRMYCTDTHSVLQLPPSLGGSNLRTDLGSLGLGAVLRVLLVQH